MSCKPCFIPSLLLNLPLLGFSKHSAGPLFTPVPGGFCMSISFLWVRVGGVGSSGSSYLVLGWCSASLLSPPCISTSPSKSRVGCAPPPCLFTAGCDLGLMVSLFNLLWLRLTSCLPPVPRVSFSSVQLALLALNPLSVSLTLSKEFL